MFIFYFARGQPDSDDFLRVDDDENHHPLDFPGGIVLNPIESLRKAANRKRLSAKIEGEEDYLAWQSFWFSKQFCQSIIYKVIIH
jgi:transposase